MEWMVRLQPVSLYNRKFIGLSNETKDAKANINMKK